MTGLSSSDAVTWLVVAAMVVMLAVAAGAGPARFVRGRETGVYRWFDRRGRLLYVGVAYDPAARWVQHQASGAVWVPYAASCSVEWFPSRSLALAAERRAIWEERPIFNVAGARPGAGYARAVYLTEVGDRPAA